MDNNAMNRFMSLNIAKSSQLNKKRKTISKLVTFATQKSAHKNLEQRAEFLISDLLISLSNSVHSLRHQHPKRPTRRQFSLHAEKRARE